MCDGVILVDKPRGMTSYDVVRGIKRASKAKRVGHAGTLDPMATGLLPICIGTATKLTQFIVSGLKEYVGHMVLGKRTDTFDCEGKVIEEHPLGALDEEVLKKAASRFIGRILQVPPPFSAAKHQGKPLYYFARKGIVINKEPKEVFIKELEIIGIKDGLRAEFRVVCSKGTYIRSLVDDLGKVLGVGAYLDSLRRTKVGPFSVEQAYALDSILDRIKSNGLQHIILDVESVLQHIPAIEIDRFMAKDVVHGVPVSAETLREIMVTQGVEHDPLVPYLRLKTRSNGDQGRTVAVCFWPPRSVHEKRIKMAKVFNNIKI